MFGKISCSPVLPCGIQGMDTTSNPLEGVSEGQTESVGSGGTYSLEEVFVLE